ncbi:PrgI family protein [Flavobacterium pectinovorum]|uniref:PrgI family protein n=1 Tax=Flavobacterium pectinovorum TaxID=29533 RepID=A0A502EST6_9FLAO|nr:PrgI family protein [Flavobacterium pectinovorum]TPG40905.1 PrgI family protein [Flavobacterium pectinovorum]
MENLNFIDPLLHGITPEITNNKIPNLSTKQLLFAGVGSLIASALLKKAGQNKTAAIVGSIGLPLIASAAYKQYCKVSKAKSELKDSSGIEYNH